MSKYCEVCSLELHDDYAYQGHLKGKKHLKNSQHAEFKKRIKEFSVFVSPIPRSIPTVSLIQFFLQFGSIRKHISGANHLILEFDSRKPVDYLLNNPVWIQDIKLNIKRRTLFETPKTTCANNLKDTVDVISFDSIRSQFENEATFDSQLNLFLDAIQLSNTEIETRYDLIRKSLDNIFAPVFPNCRTYRFGSTLTGLGFKKCDLDIYMDIGAPIVVEEETKFNETVAKEYANCWTMKRVFTRVKNVMFSRSDTFTNIRPVPRARTPIIIFSHAPTNISCDISFKNGFGIYNSLLIKHCLSCDIRIKPLIMLIKYWASQCEISGRGKISNYALILLIIFYLQQPEQGILPPLMEFQKTCEPRIINGWQINFDENTVLPQTGNNRNIPELLQGFFEFYVNFDFKTNIICPLDGIIHAKQEFKETESLPSHMARYKEIVQSEDLMLDITRFCCIQDPFELNRNVAAFTPQRIIESFQIFCIIGFEICISSRTEDYKNLLISLLYSTYRKRSREVDTLHIEVENNLKFMITIYAEPYIHVGLPENFDERTDIIDKDQYKKNNWFFVAFNIVKDIFEKVYKLKVEIRSADKETKQQKIKILSDVCTREHQQLSLHCVGQKIRPNRKSYLLAFDPSISALDKEAAISSEAVEENAKKGHSKDIELNFMCKLEKKENPVQLQLTLINISSAKKLFNEFKIIAAIKMPEIINKTFMHMLQFKKQY